MAEETEGSDAGAEASGAGVDPFAAAMALGGASRDRADSFLKDQQALIADQRLFIADQRHHLHEQLKRLKMGVFSDRLTIVLKLLTGMVGIGVAAAVAILVWNAAHADGLVVESFSVPPELAAQGLTGQVVATQMLDKLSAMQNATGTSRPAESYANNWGNDLKVEIPETGISVGEAYSFLRGWLGHETHITGEVYRTATGIAVTARSGVDAGATYEGPQTNLDALVQKAAEHIYGITQPYRYGRYLTSKASASQADFDQAGALFAQLTFDPDPLEQAWAWIGSEIVARRAPKGNDREALANAQKAVALKPDLPAPYYDIIANDALYLGYSELVLADSRILDRLLSRSAPANIDARYVNGYRLSARQRAASLLGDYNDATSFDRAGTKIPGVLTGTRPATFQTGLALSLARQHDGIAALAEGREMSPTAIQRLQMETALENWQAVVASEPSVEKAIPPTVDVNAYVGTGVRPFLALAKAKLGDTPGAEAVIATTPGDCYDCVRMRGNIASMEAQWGRADYWFAKAVHFGPSIPFAETDWGQSVLMRGDPDGAIAKFTLANQKGPHFADPLEGWGEALMKKNQSHLALAKFAEAEKYAPNWGRLHLKWGEALAYAGKKDEAAKEFTKASQLDLTADEKAELARHP